MLCIMIKLSLFAFVAALPLIYVLTTFSDVEENCRNLDKGGG